MYNLDRFLEAQDFMYTMVLNEIRTGCKNDHWMWYIFPQYKGLGHSYKSRHYAISSVEEAREYIENPTLGARLREVSGELLKHSGKPIEDILGSLDAMKLKSSMTLFDAVSPNDIFDEVLRVFFASERDSRTLSLIANQ